MTTELSIVSPELPIDQVMVKVGSEILTVVSMQVGHAKGSVELAREIAARMIAQWGGMPLPDGWSWEDYGIDCNS